VVQKTKLSQDPLWEATQGGIHVFASRVTALTAVHAGIWRARVTMVCRQADSLRRRRKAIVCAATQHGRNSRPVGPAVKPKDSAGEAGSIPCACTRMGLIARNHFECATFD
jgi:hypothetical protein